MLRGHSFASLCFKLTYYRMKAIFQDKSEKVFGEVSENGLSGVLDGQAFEWDVLQVSEKKWSVIDEKGCSFTVVLESEDVSSKSYDLKINGQFITVKAETEFDHLLKELGISAGGTKKLKEIKAPMPGLVLDVQVKEGDEVKEGDIVVILEAMKMENVIKATADATVKSIRVKKTDTIDKGEIMVTFE